MRQAVVVARKVSATLSIPLATPKNKRDGWEGEVQLHAAGAENFSHTTVPEFNWSNSFVPRMCAFAENNFVVK